MGTEATTEGSAEPHRRSDQPSPPSPCVLAYRTSPAPAATSTAHSFLLSTGTFKPPEFSSFYFLQLYYFLNIWCSPSLLLLRCNAVSVCPHKSISGPRAISVRATRKHSGPTPRRRREPASLRLRTTARRRAAKARSPPAAPLAGTRGVRGAAWGTPVPAGGPRGCRRHQQRGCPAPLASPTRSFPSRGPAAATSPEPAPAGG